MPEPIDCRCRIQDVTASGGMATVWRAWDLRPDRPVALKRTHPGPPGYRARTRFEREARAVTSPLRTPSW